MPVKVYIETAGCDRRRLDAGSIRDYLEANGHQVVTDPARADRIIAVTCAFKRKEEDESVRRLRSLRRYGRKILVYGCLADIAAGRYAEFSDLPSIAPREIDAIDRYFGQVATPFAEMRDANVAPRPGPLLVRARRRLEAGTPPSRQEALDWLRKHAPRRGGESFGGARRPFDLFVCRGCLGSCSYCAIRRAIGHVRSKPVEEVLAEFRRGVSDGYRAFNILGDDPGCYGLDRSTSLPRLLDALFDACEPTGPRAQAAADGERPIGFTIREIHPKHLIGYGAELLESERFSHVEDVLCPIQSGSDRILELMRREHSAGDLLRTLRSIRTRFPDVRLDTQIIVGFPTETDEDLARTLELITDARFDSVVVFPYDDKEGTAASTLRGKVPREETRRRIRGVFRCLRRSHIKAYYSCP